MYFPRLSRKQTTKVIIVTFVGVLILLKGNYSSTDFSPFMQPAIDLTQNVLDPPTQDWVRERFRKAAILINETFTLPQTTDWSVIRATQLYYYPGTNVVFLGIPKSGCSNWIEALLRAEGEIIEPIETTKVFAVHFALSRPHRMNDANFAGWDLSRMEKSTAITVLRNPWVRLVSGFRDKLSPEKTQGFMQRSTSAYIVSLLRKITLEQVYKEKLFPTFEEFLRYILYHEQGGGNIHWRPQYRFLKIDKILYDYVVPLELAGSMSTEIFKTFGAGHVKMLGAYDQMPDPRTQTSPRRARDWFNDVDKKLIDDLYERYKIDFMLMNYSNFSDPDFPLPLKH